MAKKKLPACAKPLDRAGYLKQISDLQAMLHQQDGRTAEVEKHLGDLSAQALEYRGRISTLENDNRALEKRLEESRGLFGDLKERLFNAEMLNNRMQGYIDRVASDDIARDEPVQIGERTLVEVQPRRPRPPFVQPPMNQPDSPSTQFRGHSSLRDTAGESLGGRKVGHWTSW